MQNNKMHFRQYYQQNTLREEARISKDGKEISEKEVRDIQYNNESKYREANTILSGHSGKRLNSYEEGLIKTHIDAISDDGNGKVLKDKLQKKLDAKVQREKVVSGDVSYLDKLLFPFGNTNKDLVKQAASESIEPVSPTVTTGGGRVFKLPYQVGGEEHCNIGQKL